VREATTRETFDEAERGTRRETIAAARAALASERAAAAAERAQVALLERRLEELRVTAPAAGRIESLDLRPGDLVAAGQPVATLLETGELWVRVYVPEPSLGRVAVGQRVAVAVDSFPGARLRRPHRRGAPPGRVPAEERPDARPAQRPGLRRQGGARRGRRAAAGHGGVRHRRRGAGAARRGPSR
jgi:multidrug efflux pump subunit AcrA (membrane-fusion protein)